MASWGFPDLSHARPVVHGILTSHSVPYGRVFRQWDTMGRLWAWCNRGELEDLPRGPRSTGYNPNIFEYDFTSIPIFHQ